MILRSSPIGKVRGAGYPALGVDGVSALYGWLRAAVSKAGRGLLMSKRSESNFATHRRIWIIRSCLGFASLPALIATALAEPVTFRGIPMGVRLADFRKTPFPDESKHPKTRIMCSGDKGLALQYRVCGRTKHWIV